jgi:hypothetical protein
MASRRTISREAPLLIVAMLVLAACSGGGDAAADATDAASDAALADGSDAAVASPARLFVRTAELDVSPPLGTVLGGYGPPGGTRKATDVHDPLMATAALFTNDAGQAFLLIGADLQGWFADLGDTGPGVLQVRQAIVDALAGSVPLSIEGVLIATSHSHSATDLIGFWQKKSTPIPLALLEQHRDWMVQLARAAAAAEPVEVRLATGSTRLEGYTARDQDCSPELDDTVGVLQARRVTDGVAAVTVVSYAKHPTMMTVGNSKASADWVWGLRTELTAATGAPVIYLQGFEAAAHDGPKVAELPGEPGSFERAYAMGKVVADTVLATLPSLVASDDVGLLARTTAVECRMTGELLIAAVEKFGVPFRSWTKGDDGYSVPGVEVSWHRVGPVELIGFPGEGSPGFARKLREHVVSALAMPVSQANDALGYLVDPDEIAADTTGQLAANELKMGLGDGGGSCVWAAQVSLGWFDGGWQAAAGAR